ncbi:MAG TPA: hypothetical protein EYP87_06585 [Flavobacteriaceae bacterium]|nr:hypothetical protein [Flavobacteriaceae bacterium]
MKILYFLFCVFLTIHTQSQVNEIEQQNATKNYKFKLYDGSDSYTMHQFSQNYLTSYRVFSRELDNSINNNKIKLSIKLLATYLIGMPLTHEEGHRSVLTHNGIGSISQPFFSSKGAAYVKGVKDNTLKNLRDIKLPTYIHLHTAGLESDYMLTNHMENLLAFESESYDVIREEYIIRKLSSILYNITTFIPSLSPSLEEETNELERDIVGHDIWGMTRHLHRPEAEFYRYTNFDDLTSIEKKYAKKLAWRSFTNLLSPILIGKSNFKLSNSIKGNFAMGHSLAPFGDYFDQRFFIIINNKFKVSSYLRENMNNKTTFFAGGFGLYDYKIAPKINISSSIDLWNQPKGLAFNTDLQKFGIATNLSLNYDFFQSKSKIIKSMGVFSDITYKTEGFLPEQPSLDEDFRVGFGVSFSY